MNMKRSALVYVLVCSLAGIGMLMFFFPVKASATEYRLENGRTTFGESSLVIGTLPLNLHYDNQTWYNEVGYMAMLGSPKSNLFISYGESDDLYGSTFNKYSSSVLRINLQIGGNANLWDRFLRLPLEIYIPIRLNGGYQRLTLDKKSAVPRQISSDGVAGRQALSDHVMGGSSFHHMFATDYIDRERNDKNFLNFNLGAGLGATLRLPLDDIPLLGAQISIDGAFVRSPGVMIRLIDDDDTDHGDSDNEIGLSISNDILLQVRVHRFLESNIGATAGVRFSGLNWSKGEDDKIGDVINAITGSDIPDNEMRYLAIYLGINW